MRATKTPSVGFKVIKQLGTSSSGQRSFARQLAGNFEGRIMGFTVNLVAIRFRLARCFLETNLIP